MKRVLRASLWASLGGLALVGCSQEEVRRPAIEPLTAQQTADARTAVTPWVGDRGQVLTICGQSDGLGLYTAQWDKGFLTDGMADGRIVFVLRSSGDPDIIFRDATEAYLSAKDDGATVTRMSSAGNETWALHYAATGVTETHNIVRSDDGLVDLWTSNKPDILVGASAKLFVAACARA